ncbi:hypothetical protein GYMLUDRAFT_139158, partial [Collybiopsis luxurians FD-317 M1]
MTAYASQGHSMDKVTVMLNSLRDHHAFYTALSRGRSVANTTILQGFDPKVITGGASGSLRKEFHEIEILDDIMRLRYEGTLDPSVQGTTRSLLIETFRRWKGVDYVPEHTHSAIKWSNKDPYLDEPACNSPWSIVDRSVFSKSKKKSSTEIILPSQGAPSDQLSGFKPKLPDPMDNSRSLSTNTQAAHTNQSLGLRLRWSNNSCAYDASFLILKQIW